MVQALQHPKRYRGFVLTQTGLQKLQREIQRLETQTKVRQSSKTIAERVQLLEPDGIHPITVRKLMRCQQGVDKRSMCHVFEALQIALEEGDYAHTSLSGAGTIVALPDHSTRPHRSQNYSGLSESLETELCGRIEETTQLRHKILVERCRLVAVLGVEGVGKTALVQNLVADVQTEFEYCVWKSLSPATPIAETLASILQSLLGQSPPSPPQPTTVESLITQLLTALEHHRCLLVLDGVETILENRPLAGYYPSEYEAYSQLFRAIAEHLHTSCLVLTSREQPRDFKRLEGRFVQSMYLEGLTSLDSQQLLQTQGIFSRSQTDLNDITAYYSGNPLFLKCLADRVQNYFNGSLCDYLETRSQEPLLFQDLRDLLEKQFHRLADLEQVVMAQLTVREDWIAVSKLQPDLARVISQQDLLDVLDSLRRRSLLQKRDAYFRLSPAMAEFIRNHKIEVTQTQRSLLLQRREHATTLV